LNHETLAVRASCPLVVRASCPLDMYLITPGSAIKELRRIETGNYSHKTPVVAPTNIVVFCRKFSGQDYL